MQINVKYKNVKYRNIKSKVLKYVKNVKYQSEKKCQKFKGLKIC